MLDVGDQLASVVPIYDGFVLRKGEHHYPHLLHHPIRARVTAKDGANARFRAFAAIQKQPTGGALLSKMILAELAKQEKPKEIVPQYLVKTKEPVEPDASPRAVLRSVCRTLATPASADDESGPAREQEKENQEADDSW